jgi:uncharacterized protein (DUF342 family)
MNMDILNTIRWLRWEQREDGMYLTVLRQGRPENWTMQEIRSVLIGRGVLNVDLPRIQAAIQAATGEPERIGDPFTFFNAEKRKHVLLLVTPLQVRFAVRATILPTDLQITRADVQFLLNEKNVCYGIDWSVIDQLLASGEFDRETIIASASPPIPGKDAEVMETVQIDTNAHPAILEDGSVDYRQIENINQVQAGDVLAVRNPPTPGIPGTSVFGNPLSPEPGEDLGLPVGKNTKPNESETELRAELNGFVYREGKRICVSSVFVADGVNFKTGNIRYQGDVLIQGDVLPGFTVVAGGNIRVEGVVESAHLESTEGSVSVRGAVVGKGEAKIVAARKIMLDSAQDASLKCGGSITVARYLRNCAVETRSLDMPGSAELSNCTVSFWDHVYAGQIGSKSGGESRFILLEDDQEKLMNQARVLAEVQEKLKKAIEDLNYKILLLRGPHLSPEQANQKGLLESNRASLQANYEHATERRKRTIRLLGILPDRDSLVSCADFYPPIRVSFYGREKAFGDESRRWKIGWKNGAIRRESI